MKGRELLIDIREEENNKRKAILKNEILMKRAFLRNSRLLFDEAKADLERAKIHMQNATKEWEAVLQKDISEIELVDKNRLPESYPGFPLIVGFDRGVEPPTHPYCRCTTAGLVEEISFGHK